MERDWALVVGINTYPSAGVDSLEGAVADADAFYNWVTDPQGGDVTEPRQSLLLTSQAQLPSGTLPRPVLSEIIQFFSQAVHVLRGTTGRRLYVFLSGHGISVTGQEAVRSTALLMADARHPEPLFGFPGNIWAEGVRSGAVFHEVVLIMDCCRDVQNNAQVLSHFFNKPTADARDGLLVEAYATGWASKAREIAFPPGNAKRGIFANSVLEVLRAGRMTGSIFKESVQAHVARTLRAAGQKPQETQIRGDPEGALARIVFNENAVEPRTPVLVSGAAAQPEILRLPPGGNRFVAVPVTDWIAENGIWKCTLPPDKYRLRTSSGDYDLPVLAGLPSEITVDA